MSNLTVTGSNMLLAGVRRAKLVYTIWEPVVIYYQDYANFWHKTTDGVRWAASADPRKIQVQIHGLGSVRANAVVVSASSHTDPFAPGFSAGFGPHV